MKNFKEVYLLKASILIHHLIPLVFCTTQQSTKPPPQNYPKEVQQIIKLAIFEEDLVTELFNLQEHFSIIPKKGSEEELCHLKVFKYVSEYEEDDLALENKKGLERAIIISEHPFLTLKMIRRLVQTLLKNTMENCRSNEKVLHALQITFKKHGGSGKVERPTDKSLEDALQRVLMIHFIYGYTDASELGKGILNGVDTKVVLNLYDCLALAKKAMDQEWLHLAYQWMSEATLRMDRDTVSDEDAVDIYDSWEELTERASFSNVPALHKGMIDKRQEELEGTGLTWNKYMLCRGEKKQQLIRPVGLVCSYDRHSDPYFMVNPIKVERHLSEPLILEFHDFVTNMELEHLKDSEFAGKKADVNFLRTVNKKIELVTKLRVKGTKKSLQRTLDTSLGSFCEIEKGSNEYVNCKENSPSKKSLATLYLNMNDVKMGGFITFPKLDIFIKPQKGSAIFWYNKIVERNGDQKIDPRTVLVTCPVIIGRKHVMKWNLTKPSSPNTNLKCTEMK